MRLLNLAAALALSTLPFAANATIITDGNVSLGVDTLGQLNVGGGVSDVAGETAVGVRWIAPSGDQYESTSHGCLCEGWGILVNGTASGYANNEDGSGGLTSLSFTGTATTATSVVQVDTTDVTVKHDFALATGTPDLFRVRVTIANTGATDVSSITYRRSMDWDASPTPFNEYVTIAGTATTTLLAHSSNNGFVNDNILSAPVLADIAGCAVDADFAACGPSDHGAAFDFNLGGILAGEEFTFDIFYGGAANKKAALAALGAVGAELYSMGWSGTDPTQSGSDGNGGLAPTFIFAFKGVGGTVIVPPSAIPVPAAGLMLLAGLGALGAARRRKVA